MQPWDKVRVIDWYYQWQDWHIEWIKEGKFVVSLKNDFWCVNTLLPEKRLESLELTEEEKKLEYIYQTICDMSADLRLLEKSSIDWITSVDIIKVLSTLKDLKVCLQSFRNSN